MIEADVSLKIIGVVHSCFRKRFGIPRQPGLIPEAKGEIELFPLYGGEQTVRGLEAFSHIWVLFLFHGNMDEGWKPMVRPPRLGGKKRVGVFASRSPFRPNPVGMSVVTLDKVVHEKGRTVIHISGVDLMDGTPVLDIKPYIPYTDIVTGAAGGYASEEPQIKMVVRFEEGAGKRCEELEKESYEGLSRFIEKILQSDPRPAWYKPHHGSRRPGFVVNIWNFEVWWQVKGDEIIVTSIEDA